MRKYKKPIMLLILSIALIWSVTSCGPTVKKEMKPSMDWSRSVSLGHSVRGSLGMVVDGAGERVHIVYPYGEAGTGTLRYLQLDQLADQVVARNIDLQGQIRLTRLLPADEGLMHLIWASRTDGRSIWALWHVFLQGDGSLASDAFRISLEEMNVEGYSVAPDAAGGLYLASAGTGSGDLYLQHLDQRGEGVSEPLLVTSGGEAPSLQVGVNGEVHLAWREGGEIMYARLPLDDLSAFNVVQVAHLNLGTGQNLTGPVLGLSDGWVYLFWSILNQSGLEAGTASTQYVAFQTDAPAAQKPVRVWMLPDEEQPYQEVEGIFPLTHLVQPLTEAWATSNYILHPAALGGQGAVLPVAIPMNQQFRLDEHLQVAIGMFENGQFKGYQLATKTENISDAPTLAADSSGHLHLVWREAAGGRKVYYATTAPTAMARLDRISGGDIVDALLQGSIESLVGVAFVPVFGFGWLLPGFVVVGLWKMFREYEDMSGRASWVPLSIALLLYQATKFITLPTIATYVPFSAWLDIPKAWSFPLRVGVPLLILATSVYVANTVRKRRSQSALLFYVSLALTDATLTLAIYGVTLLGVY